MVIQVALSYVITIVFVSDSCPATRLGDYLGVKSNHVFSFLHFLGHIFSAGWAEHIPVARYLLTTTTKISLTPRNKSGGPEDNNYPIVVDVDEDAARWWTAVLSTKDGWKASIRSNRFPPLRTIGYQNPVIFSMRSSHALL